jgi:sugar phosphate isomerase/epimerase
MKFAICLWNFEPTEETIDALRVSGVTALEPGAVFLTHYDQATIEAVGGWCRAAGIDVYVCHAPFGGANDLSLLDEDARRQAVANAKESLARVAWMGAKCVVIHPSGGDMETEKRERHGEQLMRSLDSLVKTAENIGIRLALENMLPHHLGDTCAEILEIVGHFNSPWLGICFDTGHAHLSPDGVIGMFQGLRDRIIAFHLQDNDGNHDRHLQPPYGTIDWAVFTRELQGNGFDFPWSIETPPWNGGGWDVMLREVAALFSTGLLAVPLGDTKIHVVCQQCGRYCFGTPENWFCGCDR